MKSRFRLAAVAAALVFALAGAPHVAEGGGLDSTVSQAGPRWSNDHHVPGVSVAEHCRDRADYTAGRDAWGRPVKPAELPVGSPNTPPMILDVEIDVSRQQAAGGAGRQATARVLIDPSSRPQDCIPSVK